MKYDHIIVGAGSMGSAAAYYLAKAGKHVLLLDAHTPPHNEGSHHGDTRLIRFAYGEGEKYVPFVLRAKQLWDELAKISGKTNFLQTGIINVGAPDDSFIKGVKYAAETYQLNVAQLSAQQVMERWPGIQLPDEYIALHERDSGVLLTKPCIEAYLQEAANLNAAFQFNTRVEDIVIENGHVFVKVDNGTVFEGSNVIVTVGAWAKMLLEKTEIKLPVQATRKTFAWYEAAEDVYGSNLFPGFTFQFNNESYYGFPNIDGAGLKVGRHDLGEAINPDAVKVAFGEVDGEKEDLQAFLHTYMPQVGELKEGKTCMYAMTPDEDFIIDQHPLHPEMIFAAGFSGHGFKFASAVGEALSEMAQNVPTTIDLSPFRLSRFE
jgi:N-methyl-L-tryptophan oxidase